MRGRPRGCDVSGAVCSARRGRKLHRRWRLRWRSERRRWGCRPGAAGAPKRCGAERPRHVPLPKTDRCTRRRGAAWQRGAAGRRGGSVRDARTLGGSLVRCSAAVIPASPGGTLKQRARWRPWHAKRVALNHGRQRAEGDARSPTLTVFVISRQGSLARPASRSVGVNYCEGRSVAFDGGLLRASLRQRRVDPQHRSTCRPRTCELRVRPLRSPHGMPRKGEHQCCRVADAATRALSRLKMEGTQRTRSAL